MDDSVSAAEWEAVNGVAADAVRARLQDLAKGPRPLRSAGDVQIAILVAVDGRKNLSGSAFAFAEHATTQTALESS